MSSQYEKLMVTADNARVAVPFSKTAQFAQADLEAFKENAATHFEAVVAIAEQVLTYAYAHAPDKWAPLTEKLRAIKEEVLV